MAWKKNTPEMVDFLDEALAGYKAQRRQMFGCPCYFVNDNMFAGLHQDNVMIRLSEEDRDAISAEYDEVAPFEPMKGRKMKEYLVLPESLFRDGKEFRKWLDRSYEYASALPPKKKKKAKAKAGSSSQSKAKKGR